MINRIAGLATGIDTESMVKQLMEANSYQKNKLIQQKQYEEWKRDAFRSVNTLLLDFRSKVSDLRLQSTFREKTLVADDESIVKVAKAGNPKLESYTISDVNLSTPGTPASVKIKSSVADGDTEIGSDFYFMLQGDGGTNEAIAVTEKMTMKSIVAKINNLSDQTNVIANYNEFDNSMTLSSKTTGSSSSIMITETSDAANPLNIVDGIINDSTNTFGATEGDNEVGYAPTDGIAGSLKINGVLYEGLTSNTFTYDGMKITLKETMSPGETVTITTDYDSEAIVDKIKTFVEDYNTIIDTINTELYESRYRDYKPLLDSEKEAMGEKQIEAWEERAKSGILKNDMLLNNAVTKMRTIFSSSVKDVANDAFDILNEIGITPSEDYMERGKLNIEEDKLRDAVVNNREFVEELFTKRFDTGNDLDSTLTNSEMYAKSGLAVRLYDQLNQSINDIIEKAGTATTKTDDSTIGESILSISEEIDAWETRLQDMENRYWRQFTAMEKAINQMNQQSAWLASQFNGGN